MQNVALFRIIRINMSFGNAKEYGGFSHTARSVA
jgi:hypothetical protein